jgi:hypothetical protein
MMRDDFAFDVLFWGIYGFVLFNLGWWISRKLSSREITDLRRTLAEIGDLLHKTNAMNGKEAHELRGKIKEATDELLSVRKLNVEIARELDAAVNDRDAVVKVNRDIAEENTQLRAKLEDTEKALDINDKACSANFVKLMEAKKLIRIEAAYLGTRSAAMNKWLYAMDYDVEKAPENAPEPNGD